MSVPITMAPGIPLKDASTTAHRFAQNIDHKTAFKQTQAPPLLSLIATAAYAFFSSTKQTRNADSITTLLSRLTPQHLPLPPPSKPLEVYNLYLCEHFTMCVFVMQKGVTMPIHDHPGMTVFSKLVFGDMRAKLIELLPVASGTSSSIPPSDATSNQSQSQMSASSSSTSSLDVTEERLPAILHSDTVLSASSKESSLIITPESKANLHSFTAESEYIVLLDIIGPPYDDEERWCQYYRICDDVKPMQGVTRDKDVSMGIVRTTQSQATVSSSTAAGQQPPLQTNHETVQPTLPTSSPFLVSKPKRRKKKKKQNSIALQSQNLRPTIEASSSQSLQEIDSKRQDQYMIEQELNAIIRAMELEIEQEKMKRNPAAPVIQPVGLCNVPASTGTASPSTCMPPTQITQPPKQQRMIHLVLDYDVDYDCIEKECPWGEIALLGDYASKYSGPNRCAE